MLSKAVLSLADCDVKVKKRQTVEPILRSGLILNDDQRVVRSGAHVYAIAGVIHLPLSVTYDPALLDGINGLSHWHEASTTW